MQTSITEVKDGKIITRTFAPRNVVSCGEVKITKPIIIDEPFIIDEPLDERRVNLQEIFNDMFSHRLGS